MRGVQLLLVPLLLAAAPQDPVRNAWVHLPATTNHCEDVFDYFPGGGLRILWCHAKEDLNIPQVVRLAGVPIWSSGPHKKGLDLANAREFGHYNPEFVRRIPSFALPANQDATFRQATQSTYDGVLRERARIAWVVHEKLVRDPKLAEAELAAYKADFSGPNPTEYYDDRWYDFVNSPDGNVAKTLVGFWLRRRIDGTEDEWVAVVHRVLELYDAEWLAQRSRPTP